MSGMPGSTPPPREVESRQERKARRAEKRQRKEARAERREQRAKRARPNSPTPPDRPESPGSAAEGERRSREPGVFIWKKKVDALRKRGITVTERDELQRRRELQDELERAKQQRAKRDAERAEWEAEQAQQSRLKEQEENEGWHKQEASFDGTQHHIRQAIRLRQNRPVLTDSLARNLRLDLLDVLPDPRPPCRYLDAQTEISVLELEELMEAIEVELDFIPDFPTEGDNDIFNRKLRLNWWECVKLYVANKLEVVRAKNLSGNMGSIHSSVQDDVEGMLKDKPLEKLISMETDLSSKLAGNQDDAGEDLGEVDFWTTALAYIRAHIAVEKLKGMNVVLAEERQRRTAAMPKKIEVPVTNELLEGHVDETAEEQEMYRVEAAKGMSQDEQQFADEVDLKEGKRRQSSTAGFGWNDKYRPRKPRYLNRVHTGYNWTKYNRTHYDHDNPPPKTVQGYKFNIFYPDLIDKTKTPTFFISKTDNPEVSIITFKAGPPYEDLAFKIVNRPWEHSHRRGFRCSFDRGILHLWVNFQRYYYRR